MSYAAQVDVEGNAVTVKRLLEDGYMTLRVLYCGGNDTVHSDEISGYGRSGMGKTQ